MKNIHIIPTDKPSRLHKIGNELGLTDTPNSNFLAKQQNIYITSDEVIKDRDWLIVNDEDVMQMKSSYDNDMTGEDIWVGDSLNGYATYKDNCKKIILTTDQDLIANGVQSIDNKFLEWFVKNPSCEKVKVSELRFFNPDTNESAHCKWEYDLPQEEPKQETLEEASSEYVDSIKNKIDSYCYCDTQEGFQQGAKWQAERMYSEEDLRKAFENGVGSGKYQQEYGIKGSMNFEDWFEQFKKK
jgi:hypothetical protein